MRSKWYEFKEDAIALRKRGYSIRKIEVKLGVPRSTLSGWLRSVSLSETHRAKLQKAQKEALVKARRSAVKWHKEQKIKRIEEAQSNAQKSFSALPSNNLSVLKLALALLYLGEGSKKNTETAMGASDPTMLQFFLNSLEILYGVSRKDFICELHLRYDQDPGKSVCFWARSLNIPTKNFHRVNRDIRTKGKATYGRYKGVCNIRCGNVAIQRELVALSDLYLYSIAAQNK